MNNSTARQNEDKVQTLLNNYCESLGFDNHPKEGNKNIFGVLKPDGWYIDEERKLLFIFECKCKKSQWKQAKPQLQQYITVSDKFVKENELYVVPIFVYGETKRTFTMLYVSNFETDELKPFDDIVIGNSNINQQTFSPKEFNEYIYNNFPNIGSNERLKLVISVLLTKYTIPTEQLKPPLFMRVLETEKLYNMESEFEFITHEPYNKIVDIMFEFLNKVDNENILNILYSCFVEISVYSFKGLKGAEKRKQTTQTEGAVLTPPDIVNLMINELDIKSSDVVCDPCCGTANFIISVLSKTNLIIGNELDLTRFIAAKHGLIISGIHSPTITNNDCLNNSYNPTFDWLLMNPPYNHGIEQKFMLKFIKLARKGGSIIVPISNFQQQEFQDELKKICVPLKLIILNNNVFYPTIPNLNTCIFVFSKSTDPTINSSSTNPTTNTINSSSISSAINNNQFKLYNFRKDGSECIRKNNRLERVVNDENKEMIFDKVINEGDDWRLSLPVDYDQEFKNGWIDYVNDISNAQLLRQYNNVKLHKSTLQKVKIDNNWLEVFDVVKFTLRTFKVSDFIDYVGKGKAQTKSSLPDGEHPLISRSSFNQGIIRFVDRFDYEPNDDEIYLTIAGGGGTGDCFIQLNKFAATSCTSVFMFKDDWLYLSLQSLRIIAYIITCKFKLNYTRNNNLNLTSIMNETIELPICDNETITDESLYSLLY